MIIIEHFQADFILTKGATCVELHSSCRLPMCTSVQEDSLVTAAAHGVMERNPDLRIFGLIGDASVGLSQTVKRLKINTVQFGMVYSTTKVQTTSLVNISSYSPPFYSRLWSLIASGEKYRKRHHLP